MKTVDTTVETTNGETTSTTGAPKKVAISFGNGRYSNVAEELFKDSQRLLLLDPAQAEKLARSYASDLGRISPKVAKDGITIGKPAKKDRTVTLKESTMLKGVTLTYSLALAKLCVILQEATHYGASDFTPTIRTDFMDWLNGKPVEQD